MNNAMRYVLTFSFGVAVGVVCTRKLFKTRYEQYAQEEINSVIDYYSDRHASTDNKEVEIDLVKVDRTQDVKEYADKLEELGYTDNTATDVKERENGVDSTSIPYVIPPEEFGMMDDYETNSLTYYADGVLADDVDDVVEDVDRIVGSESLNHFGQYEDDSVFVRNDALKRDYEILLDERNYSDVNKRHLFTPGEN